MPDDTPLVVLQREPFTSAVRFSLMTRFCRAPHFKLAFSFRLPCMPLRNDPNKAKAPFLSSPRYLIDVTKQLVFHFAKHEEIKRMVAVMDIAVLLERLHDAFLADKSLLFGQNGSLSPHFINDIDMAFRVRLVRFSSMVVGWLFVCSAVCMTTISRVVLLEDGVYTHMENYKDPVCAWRGWVCSIENRPRECAGLGSRSWGWLK